MVIYVLRFASKLVSKVREKLSYSVDTITVKYTIVRINQRIKCLQETLRMDSNIT